MTIKQLLKECHLFESLSDEEIDNIASISQVKDYEAGASIFDEKAAADELYVVEKGKVALQKQMLVTRLQLSKKVTVDIVNPTEVFGWSVLVAPYRYTLTATCLEATRVLATDGVRLRSLVQGNHRIGYEVLNQLIKVVASRLDDTCHVLISERLLSV
ncbi:MAG: cyclic nucleotide-binding domain-containing protein [Chloroflexi bacterium]|nr:cyclic nucleotide-binding domain-containing protein [Chloroflexota bacterium]